MRTDHAVRPATGTVEFPILTVTLRSSVGSTWTIVLDEQTSPSGGHPVGWISSGVPIEEPPPTDIAGVLKEHGYRYLPAQLRGDRLHGTPCKRLGFAWKASATDASETYLRLRPTT